MSGVRVGLGYDAHRFGGLGPVILCGVAIDHPVGVLGTSNADVAAHAVCDALLGAAALGDLGKHFPSDDERWLNVDSIELVSACGKKVRAADFDLGNIDVTIIAQDVRVAPHRDQMRSRIAVALQIPIISVSVKASTTDGLGWIGSGDGLAAQAIATIYR